MTKAAVEPGAVKSLLMTSDQKAKMDDAFLDLKVAEALTPAEIADPSLIGRREKLRVAGAAGTEVARVNRFLDAFEQSKNVHRWLASRKARQLPIPTSFDEYIATMSADKVGSKAAAMKLQMGRVRSQRQMLKRM